MSIANLQQTIHNRQLTIYNLDMSNFDAVLFAEWLKKAFEDSNFKTFTALADSAKLQRSTVSALANAKPQVLTSKASQPKPETVIALAKALNQDVDKALLLAGHAPLKNPVGIRKPRTPAEFFDILDELGMEINLDGGIKTIESLDEDDLQELLDSVVANAVAKARRKSKTKVI